MRFQISEIQSQPCVCIVEDTVPELSCDHSVVVGWLQSADEFSLVDDGIYRS